MRKIRVMYNKTGRAIYISHLDIMRTFQRALKRAGIDVKHTEGFNPHPYISIALPLSLGYSGRCEFLDMVVLDDMPCKEIIERLNKSLPEGIEATKAYDGGRPVREIAYSEFEITFEYDAGVPDGAVDKIRELLMRDEIVIIKKSKSGEKETNIAPMIKKPRVETGEGIVKITVCLASGNVSLNPEYISKAVEKYLPDFVPDFAEYERLEVYNEKMEKFR